MFNRKQTYQTQYSLAALLISFFVSLPAMANNLPVQTKSIKAEPFNIQINRTGRIDFRYTTNLSFKTPGYIQQLSADEGQRVFAGDTLGTIELTDLKAAQASAQATYEKAVQDAVRARKLYKQKKTVSKDFLEQAETALIQAKSGRKRVEYDLAKARIEAPFDAVVIKRLMQPGEQAQAGSPVFSVASLGSENLIVRLNLTQQEIIQVKPLDLATVTLANQKKIGGHILSISAIAEQATGLYEVEVALDAKGYRALPGQWVQTTIGITSEQLSYPIPVIALAGIINGQANFVIQQKSGYKRQSFDVLHMDQQFIYVPATSNQIKVAVRGWERLLNRVSQ